MTVITHMFQNGTCAVFIQFFAKINIPYMFSYGWSAHRKHLGNLILSQPYCFILYNDFQTSNLIRLINNDLTIS